MTRRAYEQAAVLVGVEAQTTRLRRAREGLPKTRLLAPAHDVLLWRFTREVNDGRQQLLFATDQDEELRRIWCRFAVGYMRRPGQALVQRALERARVLSVKRVELQLPSVPTEATYRFCEAMGFRDAERGVVTRAP